MKMKKIALLFLTGALIMNTVPCYAASGSGGKMKVSTTSEDGTGNYTQIPSAETLQKDIGFIPKTPDTLAGGFQFASGSIVESYDIDSSGNAFHKKSGIDLKYTKAAENISKSVTLVAEPKSNQDIPSNATTTKYGEVDLHFNSQYASYLCWFENDIFYHLIDIDNKVTEEEMIAIAKEIIDMIPNKADVK